MPRKTELRHSHLVIWIWCPGSAKTSTNYIKLCRYKIAPHLLTPSHQRHFLFLNYNSIDKSLRRLTFDNLAHANGEFKGLSAVPRGVEFLSARQGAGVVDLDLLAVLGVGGAIAWLVSFDLKKMLERESGRWSCHIRKRLVPCYYHLQIWLFNQDGHSRQIIGRTDPLGGNTLWTRLRM